MSDTEATMKNHYAVKPLLTDDVTMVSRHTKHLIAETRDEIRRADAKAAQWLTTLGAASAAALAAWTTRGSTPWELAGIHMLLTAAGGACAVGAMAALTLALIPRIGGSSEPGHVAYFGHVYRIGDPDRVRRLLEGAAADLMPGLVAELCTLSRIAMLKYRYTRLGAVLSALASVLIIAGSI